MKCLGVNQKHNIFLTVSSTTICQFNPSNFILIILCTNSSCGASVIYSPEGMQLKTDSNTLCLISVLYGKPVCKLHCCRLIWMYGFPYKRKYFHILLDRKPSCGPPSWHLIFCMEGFICVCGGAFNYVSPLAWSLTQLRPRFTISGLRI